RLLEPDSFLLGRQTKARNCIVAHAACHLLSWCEPSVREFFRPVPIILTAFFIRFTLLSSVTSVTSHGSPTLRSGRGLQNQPRDRAIDRPPDSRFVIALALPACRTPMDANSPMLFGLQTS